MIFVGPRQCGKTYMAMNALKKKCKKGDTVGIIARNFDVGRYLKRVFTSCFIKDSSFVNVKLIQLHEIDFVDYVLIDDLDLVLGKDKCFCSSGGVVELQRIDEDYISYINNIKDEYSFSRKVYCVESDSKKLLEIYKTELDKVIYEISITPKHDYKHKIDMIETQRDLMIKIAKLEGEC